MTDRQKPKSNHEALKIPLSFREAVKAALETKAPPLKTKRRKRQG